jgi:uncharacterized protein YndB with AHSA1/START domain
MDARSHSSSPGTPRSAEYVIPIAASPDVVWKALTDPRELERWFPLTASVTPGVGGALTLRWRDIGMDHLAISIWKPGAHLQVGMPQPGGAPHVIHDFTIEDHGTSTVLRLVAHGFDPDARWDEFYDGVRRGWRYELESLRYYLTHHRGQDRGVAWVRTPLTVSTERAWAMALASHGLKIGTVLISDAPRDFTGVVEEPELNHGLLRIEIDAVMSIWLATWGVSETKLSTIQDTWQTTFTKTF